MPTDFFGRVMAVFSRYGVSMLQGAGVSLQIALVEPLQAVSLALQWALSRPYPQKREIIRSNGESCGS